MTTIDAAEDIGGSADERNTTVAASSARPAKGGDCGNGTRLAAAASAANGTTNFINAANQIQYRTDALLLRNISTNSAAAAPAIVDCQM